MPILGAALHISSAVCTKHRALVRCFRGRPIHTRVPAYTRWRGAAAGELHKQWGARPQLTGEVTVRIDCHWPKRTVTFSRGDVDNMAKCVLDTLTHAGVWKDDRQVVRLTVTKKIEPGPAGVRIGLSWEE